MQTTANDHTETSMEVDDMDASETAPPHGNGSDTMLASHSSVSSGSTIQSINCGTGCLRAPSFDCSVVGSDDSLYQPNDRLHEPLTHGEKFWAKELRTLGKMEREKLFDDLHAVKSPIAETSEMINSCLEALDEELSKIRKKEAYQKAAFLSPPSVRNREFRLQALRSAEWQPYRAAQILVKSFERRMKLLGEENFLKPMQWKDFTPTSQQCMLSGAYICHQDNKDVVGRPVGVLSHPRCNFESPAQCLQAMMYMNTGIALTAESQQRGWVLVINMIGASTKDAYKLVLGSQIGARWGIMESLSPRLASVHILFRDPAYRPILSSLFLSMPSNIRLRIKMHFGSVMECAYALATYGIPAEALNLDDQGHPRMEVVQKALEMRRLREAEEMERYTRTAPLNCLRYPSKNDVVLGRGWPYQSFTGNVQLSRFLEHHLPMYERAATRQEKSFLVDTLLAQVLRTGVRFLRRDETGDYWEVADGPAARRKISISLRNLSRK